MIKIQHLKIEKQTNITSNADEVFIIAIKNDNNKNTNIANCRFTYKHNAKIREEWYFTKRCLRDLMILMNQLND